MLRTILTVTCPACASENDRRGESQQLDQDCVLFVVCDDAMADVEGMEIRVRRPCGCEGDALVNDPLLVMDAVREHRSEDRSSFGRAA